LVGVRAGLRPGSPDHLPIIGWTALDGLAVATGHFRNGILLTPVTAEAVAALLSGEPGPDEVRPCDPRRFAGGPVATGTVGSSPRRRPCTRRWTASRTTRPRA